MRAAEVMSRPVVTVRPDDTLEDVAALLTQRSITSAPVLDESGDLIGMVSESDLLLSQLPPEGAAARYRPPSLRRRAAKPEVVADVMVEDIVTVAPDADVADLAKAMVYHDVRSVPVVDDQANLVGIVSRRDLLRTMVRNDETIGLDVQHRLDEYAGGRRRWTATVAEGAATVVGECDDEVEERVIVALAATVPGVSTVDYQRTARIAG